MEKHLTNKVEKYIANLKNDIKSELLKNPDNDIMNIIQFIMDYEPFIFEKEDFQKRKKQKNIVPLCNRCCSKRADNEQCTRKKRPGSDYCGTHMKSVEKSEEISYTHDKIPVQKKEVFAQDIQGIIHYIDKLGNVYKTEDIMSNKMNPTIIANYLKENDKFTIINL